LAVVRSLGRRGIPVWVLYAGDDVLAARSRFTSKRLPLEGERDDERARFLLSLAEEHGLEGWTLFPTGDETVAMVARAHDQLQERFLLTSPPWPVLRWADDKRLTYSLAESLSIPTPRTWAAASAAEAGSLPLEFPVIVKPAVKEELNALTAAKAWRAGDRDELTARFAEAASLLDASLVMIQELIPGGGETQFSYAALCDGGRPLATVVARRTRQYPADFGRASTFVETIECPEIVDPSERLLAEIRFNGLVELEFKRDPRDGQFKLLDINPRVWGWHSLCQRAGVDFPYLAFRLARSEPVPASRSQIGVSWLRLSTDLPTSLREIARGRLSAVGYLRSLFSKHDSAVFARDDPWPALLEFPMLAGTFLRRLRRGDAV
ncbi:MAG TPA: ATP-grasp domain-containing protein, partial [Solirubrobacteraceae bacterium]|nr:ATP-grasp domain-containing protein [Solirubrobacteraceae bacterium]